MTARAKPHIISMSANSRTLFSLIDILMRCFCHSTNTTDNPIYPSLNNLVITPLNDDGSYLSCQFHLQIPPLNDTHNQQTIPCHLVYQAWQGEQDDSKDSPLGHQITMTYPDGVLSLQGTFGPCLWSPLVASMNAPQTVFCQDLTQQTHKATVNDLLHWREKANHFSMQQLIAVCDTNNAEQQNKDTAPYQQADYLQHLCDQWQHIYQALHAHYSS